MPRTEADYRAEANRIKAEIDAKVAEGDNLIDYFTGNVYGDDGNGRWIIGYGVYGPGGHILVCPRCVSVCGVDSEPFDRESGRALKEVMEAAG